MGSLKQIFSLHIFGALQGANLLEFLGTREFGLQGLLQSSFFTWLAAHNRLATGDRILWWNPQADPVCWLCKSEVESRDHLFFECSYSKEVWKGTVKNLGDGKSLSME